MSVNPVALCADLQAWHNAGLYLLYFPEAETAQLLGEAQRRFAARRRSAGEEKAAPGKAHSRSSDRSAAEYRRSGDIADNSGQRLDDASKTATDIADMRHCGPEAAGLPEAWEAVARKLRPAPVIWTYKELGEDLLIRGDPARSKALRELIGSLGLKGGSSAFLPTVLPGRPADGSEAGYFQAVLSRLNGRILVAFGPEVLALGPYASLKLEIFQERVVRGRMLLCLPALGEILQFPARFEATKVFLRSAFARINIR